MKVVKITECAPDPLQAVFKALRVGRSVIDVAHLHASE